MYEELVKQLRDMSIFCNSWIDLYAEAADAIEELSLDLDVANTALYDALPRWISVDEQLPPKGKNVLVYVHSEVDIGYLTDYTANGSTCWVVGHNSYESLERNTVKAWMPLPTPPEEEKK